MRFNRKDGSYFDLTPILDGKGQQKFERFFTQKGKLTKIPVFFFHSPNFDGMDNKKIWADIEPTLMKESEYYRERIANILISYTREELIFNNLNGFAGGFDTDRYGDIKLVKVDQCILEAIRIKRGLSKKSKWGQEQSYGQIILMDRE